MENTSYLYDTLVRVLSQHANWLDLRHLKTLAWMMVGLINSYSMSLGAWTPFVISRAQYSQSTVRRFRRWSAVSGGSECSRENVGIRAGVAPP